MIKLDDNLLAELGLHALPVEEKRNLLRHIYETLEMRVGTTLAQQMTDAQLDEFESFINNNDEAGALHWLETNFPNYKDVVASEFERLKNEVRQAAPQILASVSQAAATPQPLQQYQQTQQSMQAPTQPQYQQPSMPQPPQFDPAMYQQPAPQPMPQPPQPTAYPPQQQPMSYPTPTPMPPQMPQQYQQPQPGQPSYPPQTPRQDQYDQAA